MLWRASQWNQGRLPVGGGTWWLRWALENRIPIGRDSQGFGTKKCGKVWAHSGSHMVETWELPGGAVEVWKAGIGPALRAGGEGGEGGGFCRCQMLLEHCGPASEVTDPPSLVVSQAPEYPLQVGAAPGFWCTLWVYFPSAGRCLGMQVGQDWMFAGSWNM